MQFASHFTFVNSLFSDKVYCVVRAGLEGVRVSPAPAAQMLRLLVSTMILDSWRHLEARVHLLCPSYVQGWDHDHQRWVAQRWLSRVRLWIDHIENELRCATAFTELALWAGLIEWLRISLLITCTVGSQEARSLRWGSGGPTASADEKWAFLPVKGLDSHCREDRRRGTEESFLGNCAYLDKLLLLLVIWFDYSHSSIFLKAFPHLCKYKIIFGNLNKAK